MRFTKSILALALFTVIGAAHATMVDTTSGATTTYSENFDGATSFSTGWFDAQSTTDDYLWFNGSVAPTWNLTSPVALQSVTISFWYSVPDGVTGAFKFGSEPTVALADTPGNEVQFNSNNPGPKTGVTFGDDYDAKFSITYTGIAAGTNALTFMSKTDYTYNLGGVKIDDLVITTVAAVPEPETWALMFGGLGAIGLAVRRSSKTRR